MEAYGSQPRSDEGLVAAYNAGQARALDILIERHYRRVVGQVYQRLRDEEVAREVAQDVFMRVTRALPRFRGDSTFTTWLHRITANICIDRMRLRHRRPAVDPVDTVPDTGVQWSLTPRIHSPHEHVVADELAAWLDEAIAQLPPAQQRVFRMRHYDHMRLAAIADEVDRSLGTVKANLFSARSTLRKALAEYAGESV